ncbi:MAG: VOC family protein [Candidatus Promineifilaceae bacterium]|nr:VOC family protein [Candidatus Promineifilaceae bacterium]
MEDSFFKFQQTNIILYCRNWSDSVYFYRNRLRLPVSFENDWFVELQLTDHSYLSIANAARASIQDVGGQGLTLTWKVADLQQAKQRLEELGIETTPIKQKWNAQVMFITDPEGHRIELWANNPEQVESSA